MSVFSRCVIDTGAEMNPADSEGFVLLARVGFLPTFGLVALPERT